MLPYWCVHMLLRCSETWDPVTSSAFTRGTILSGNPTQKRQIYIFCSEHNLNLTAERCKTAVILQLYPTWLWNNHFNAWIIQRVSAGEKTLVCSFIQQNNKNSFSVPTNTSCYRTRITNKNHVGGGEKKKKKKESKAHFRKWLLKSDFQFQLCSEP